MADWLGSYFSDGLEYKDISLIKESLPTQGTIIYEVLRVIKGSVLFLEDHIERFQNSINLSGLKYSVSVSVWRYILRNLIKYNKTEYGNIKILICFETGQTKFLSYFIQHSYPAPSMYSDGVNTDFFKALRNDPNIKKLNSEMIQKVSTFIKTENLYDALLVANNDEITEGSKTNVFFIKEKSVYTSPGNKVLKGITRQKIIQLCKDLDIPVFEIPIKIKDLHNYNAAFFTGTSPKVLPIRTISNIEFDTSDNIMRKLMKSYDQLIADYIDKRC